MMYRLWKQSYSYALMAEVTTQMWSDCDLEVHALSVSPSNKTVC